MGIAFKDLKPGQYYKATVGPQKLWVYVVTIAPVGASRMQAMVERIERRTQGAKWAGTALNGAPHDDSGLKRDATVSEVTGEGVSRAPSDKTTPPPAPKPVTTGSGTKAPSTPSASNPPKPPALRKDGTPKVSIPDNSRSSTCLHCRKPTRTMTLLQFSAQWCPECEP